MIVKPQYNNLLEETFERVKKLERSQRRTIHNHHLVAEFDNGDDVIEIGIAGDYPFNIDCRIMGWRLVSTQIGSIVIDVWKTTLDNHPPTVADSITASSQPSLVADNKATDDILDGWLRQIYSGDVLRFNVISCSGIQRCTLVLELEE